MDDGCCAATVPSARTTVRFVVCRRAGGTFVHRLIDGAKRSTILPNLLWVIHRLLFDLSATKLVVGSQGLDYIEGLAQL